MKPVKKGFSLIEFVIVIGILGILVAFVLVIINSFQKERFLNASAEEIINSLRFPQSKTLASEQASSYGIYFENNKYALFRGNFFDPASPDSEIHWLPSSLIISQINLSDSTSSVAFERLTGYAGAEGTIKIEMVSDANKNKVIYIGSSGVISLASSSVDDVDRLKDSRHVHILYSQNTKSAATLTLFFPDDSHTETIDYQSYLNADKTEFNWEEILIVGGINQKLKINSHELSDTQTLFCIHRDRRYNTKALNISLDGQNLINYNVDGGVSQGSSFWVDSPSLQ